MESGKQKQKQGKNKRGASKKTGSKGGGGGVSGTTKNNQNKTKKINNQQLEDRKESGQIKNESGIETEKEVINQIETVATIVPENENGNEIRKPSDNSNSNSESKMNQIIQLSNQEFYSLAFDAYRLVIDKSSSSSRSYNQPLLVCKGYLNSGNTCFVNCVLQSILSLPRIQKFILEFKELCSIPQIPTDLTTWARFLSLSLNSFISPPSTSSSSSSSSSSSTQSSQKQQQGNSQKILVTNNRVSDFISPCWTEYLGSLVDVFRQEISPISVTSQADAMEFFTYLLDRLHEEMLQGQETLQIPFNRDDEFTTTSLPIEDEWEEVGRGGTINHVDQVSRRNAVMLNNSTIISSIFHGTLRSEVKYPNKKATSISYQRFHCLSLDLTLSTQPHLQNQPPSLDIHTALEAYFREETLSDSRLSKKVSLESIPSVLVLQLQRFTYQKTKQTIVKIKRDVIYPETLTLSRHHLTSSLIASLTSPPTYHLHAVIMHHGNTADGGHYTAFCREDISSSSSTSVGGAISSGVASGGQWRHIDDTNVTSVTKNQILTAKSQAYLLFYCRSI